MPVHRTRQRAVDRLIGWIVLATLIAPLSAEVRGTVVNATTGQPAVGVALTLSTFSGGMRPIKEVQSGADGSFTFTKELPSVAAGQPFQGAIRAEYEGIGYTEILGSDSAHDNIRITVYSVQSEDIPPPEVRVLLFQPDGSQLEVHELYQFVNDSDRPVTYSSEDGSLRFHLPAEAGGEAEVSATGPAGMPLRSSALPTDDPDIYKVDFPIKPGENRIDISYRVPHEDGGTFTVRSLYPTMQTRVAAPAGVQIGGEGLTDMGQEPTTKASTYLLSSTEDVALAISGQGRLRSGASGASSGQSEISIEPAPVARELLWLSVLAVLILSTGYLHLLRSRLPADRGAGPGGKG